MLRSLCLRTFRSFVRPSILLRTFPHEFKPFHITIERNFNSNSSQLAKKTAKKATSSPKSKFISIPPFVLNSNLANLLGIRFAQLAKSLSNLGFEDDQLGHDYILDHETAALIANEFGFTVTNLSQEQMDDKYDVSLTPETTDPALLKPRPPIVTIMGHVDHGKTTILDFLRKSSIVASEHGGITQHIGAFSVITPVTKKKITFLDTPGHAAFLKMRERGANVTDIVVLVVAADDSVMPQTIEAIKHCQKHNSNIILAINKCDKPNANPQKVLSDLTQHGIFAENFGGDIQAVEVSGLTGLNMDKLEEEIVTLAEVLDLQAQFTKTNVEGHVLESQVKKGAGNVATILIKKGSLKNGTILTAGETWCKVKALKNEFGKMVKLATPAMPVEVYGWKELPEAGDVVIQVDNESKAKAVIDYRKQRSFNLTRLEELDKTNKARLELKKQSEKDAKLREILKYGLSLEDLKAKEREIFADEEKEKALEGPKEIPFIIKADVTGSAEAIVESISHIGNDEVKAKVIYNEVGEPNDSDLDRAEAAGATILCFNIKPAKEIVAKAEQRSIDFHEYTVIYHLIEKVTEILSSHLKPIVETKVVGEAIVKAVFSITNPKTKKKFDIAGSRVTDGIIDRKSTVMVKRGDKIVFKGMLEGIKSGKDEASSIGKGKECGIRFNKWEQFQEGDVIEAYETVETPRFL